MNYIGSKKHLLEFIANEISLHVSKKEKRVFCDLFSGTGCVGEYFQKDFTSVIANDIEPFAYILTYNKVKNQNSFDLSFVLDNYKEKEGFISKHYAKERNYFSLENAMKIDGIRDFIGKRYEIGDISKDAYYFYLASLLFSADRVANTTGVYGSFLKRLKFMAKTKMKYLPHSTKKEFLKDTNRVYNEDANSLIRKLEGDVLYLDPPYNHRQYGLNYHVLNAITLNKEFQPRGVCGYDEYYRSPYCQKKKAAKALEELVKKAKFKTLLLSYSADGILDTITIEKILSRYGRYKRNFYDHPRYRTNKNSRKGHVRECLHVVQKYGM